MYLNKLLNTLKTFFYQTVLSFRFPSILGVILLLTISLQCLSGIMLSFSLMTDSSLTAVSRETEDMDALYIDDFFWLHERGVDFIFISIILHLFRKFFQKSNGLISESSWKSGSFMFLMINGAIFSGLVLCCTHLSDITLRIATNIVKTLTLKVGNLGYFVYTDETLNTDTMVRLAYLHYILPFIILILSTEHLVDMHFSHRDYSFMPNRRITYVWSIDVLKTEFLFWLKFLFLFSSIALWIYHDNEPLNFEIFMWGDIGFINDIRFLGVAPHWYFRPFMAFLICCPHHYFGILGLLYIFIIIYFQPKVMLLSKKSKRALTGYQPVENSLLFLVLTYFFIMSCLYVTSYLPFGRFYISKGGNPTTTIAFLYIFFI